VTGAGAAGKLTATTMTLSLAGTSGLAPPWNDRRKSEGHVSIPLLTREFVEALPMVTRLMNDIGAGLAWIDKGETSLFEEVLGSKVFFVANAAEALDSNGRRIIPAGEFVSKFGVRTVFGMGGSYLDGKTLAALILFTNEPLTMEKVRPFSTLMPSFISRSMPAVLKDHFWSD
jgi:hypothetical protein